jgi:hypothetical protein
MSTTKEQTPVAERPDWLKRTVGDGDKYELAAYRENTPFSAITHSAKPSMI